ncbi:hypothetical protein [Kibdelosporangium aridum]|uniref:hypothetical protein n=1 Tax=Kibdelosporangium aridum TaxID=2030 RepID=UPI0035EC2095
MAITRARHMVVFVRPARELHYREDQGVTAEMATNALRTIDTAVIDVAPGPAAIEKMRNQPYDVAIVDMLFRRESDDFENRRRPGHVGLNSEQLHLSGLAVLHPITAHDLPTRPVVWSSGEANRRLHMIFAYEVLGCRVLCSKEAVGDLPLAVAAALERREYVRPVLKMYLTPGFARPLEETLLASSARLRIWRAMASEQHQHKAIAKSAGWRPAQSARAWTTCAPSCSSSIRATRPTGRPARRSSDTPARTGSSSSTRRSG